MGKIHQCPKFKHLLLNIISCFCVYFSTYLFVLGYVLFFQCLGVLFINSSKVMLAEICSLLLMILSVGAGTEDTFWIYSYTHICRVMAASGVLY